MGENSNIAWTDHTFNPWWGCEKISEGCKNCYAERDSKRHGGAYWGKDAPRRFFGEPHWKQIYTWNRNAQKAGKSAKVFCGSMCDVFEDRQDIKPERHRLWNMIEDTEHLEWLLLTKRPENIFWMIPWNDPENFPDNVWFGTTIECQEHVDRLLPMETLTFFTDQIFVSVEPMLGPVDFGMLWHIPKWVIIGGESGPNCREMKRWWMGELSQACVEHGIPVFNKQLGGFPDKRDDPDQYPMLTRRQFPQGLT